MSDEEQRAKELDEMVKAADKAKKDAEMAAGGNDGERLDKILACLSSLGQRMDSYDEEEKKKADAADEDMPMSVDEEEDREELKAAAGDEPSDPKKLAADARADSAQFESATRGMKGHIEYVADSAFRAWGENCPKPYNREGISEYRRRIAGRLQRHSPAWKEVDLSSLSGQSLRNATAQIFADSISASTNPTSYDANFLREVQHLQRDGRVITEFVGRPSSWMRQFSGTPRRATVNRYPDGRDTRGA